jgi:hypothetical protein
MDVTTENRPMAGALAEDQRGVARPENGLGDIGSIENR